MIDDLNTTKMIIMRLDNCTSVPLTEDIVLNSLNTFQNKPVILRGIHSANYIDKNNTNVVGVIKSVEYKNRQVLADIFWYDNTFRRRIYDNWGIEMARDNKSFKFCWVEIL